MRGISVLFVTAGDEEEAMEVERWGEEEEVAMDIDVSQEDIAEMKLVRRSPLSPEHLRIELFGIPADYSNNFTVRHFLFLCLFLFPSSLSLSFSLSFSPSLSLSLPHFIGLSNLYVFLSLLCVCMCAVFCVSTGETVPGTGY